MNKILLILLCNFLFFSCKMNSPLTNQATTGIGEFEVEENRVFSSSQMKTIKEICRNLKSKRDYFNTLDDMKVRFKFNIETLSCDGKTITRNTINTVLSNTSSTDLEYFIDRDDYLRNVITDQTQGIKFLCDNVDAVNLKNTFFDSNLRYTFDVLINQGFNRLVMIKSVRDSSGKYIPRVGEGIDMISTIYQGPQKLFGMESERMRSTKCSSGVTAYTKQSWVRE